MIRFRSTNAYPTRIVFCSLLFAVLVFNGVAAQQGGTNFFVTAGRQASISDGDTLFRAVYFIGCPMTYSGPLYLRIFDADIGGRFDQTITPSTARYRLFGKGGIHPRVRSIQDPIDGKAPLIDLELGKDDLYDNQWRTLIPFHVKDGEPIDSLSTFQFIVDGTSGTSVNMYQIFVSSDEKRNNAVDGIRITAPVISLLIPASNTLVTQIPFRIPRSAKTIVVHNFDADGIGEIFIQTAYREKIPVCVSGNGISCSSRIPIQEKESGSMGALIIGGERNQADYVQCWIVDELGAVLPFQLPPMLSPMNHLPVPKWEAIPLSDCLSFVLDAAGSTDPDNDEMSFQWWLGDQPIGEGRRIVHQFPKADQYPVRLVVRDHSGFIANTGELTKSLQINSPPSAEFDAPRTAAPSEVLAFDASRSRDTDGRVLRYLWDFGNGGKAEGKIVQYAYALAGRYRFTLRVEDDSQSPCNSGEKTAAVWINSPPVPRIQLKGIAAVDENIQMDGKGSIDSDGEIVRYAWDLGDGGTAEEVSVTHRYRAPGTYRVQLSVQDNADAKNSTQKIAAIVVVNAPPVASAKGKSIVSVQEAVAFDASGSRDPDGQVVEYKWDFGDGSTQMGIQAQHAYGKPGRFDVVLTVRDNSDASNNEATTHFPIRVNSPPVPNAGGDRMVNSSTVFFDASASRDEDDRIIDYAWDFGDNISARGEKVRHTYVLPGTYRVTLNVKDGSGTGSGIQSDQITVKVNHPPVADAGRNRIVAVGENVVLDASFSHDPDGEIVEYLWEVDRGVMKSGKRVEHVYKNPKTYQALLTVRDNAGAEDVHSAEIVVNAGPTAVITPIARSAPGQTVVFDGSRSVDSDGEIVDFRWDFGDGSPARNAPAVSHTYSKPGRYQTALTVRDNSQASNGTGVATAVVSINHAPVPVPGQDKYSCSQTIHFDASRSFDADSDPLYLFWNFGDSITGVGAQVTHTYKRPGVYPVRLMADDGCGLTNSKAEVFIKVHINSAPSAAIDAGTEVCAGENVLFDASRSSDPDNDPLKYVWDFGDGNSGEGVNPVHMYKKGGFYRVLMTVMDNSGLQCNQALAETVIHVIDAPVAEAGTDRVVCANKPIVFDGSLSSGGNRPIQSYEWDFGDGQQSGGVRTFHTFVQAGLYTVLLKITVPPEGNCENSSEDHLTVKVMPSPVVAFNFSSTGCEGMDMFFDATASKGGEAAAIQYEWDFGDSTSGKGVKTTHRYQRSGKYNVRLTVVTDANQECNTAYLEHTVFINARPRASMQITSATDNLPTLAPYSSLYFNAQKSEDGDGYIRRYRWMFGDGESAEGVFVHHQYKRSGRYTVKLEVEDNSGTPCSIDTASTVLMVVDTPVWSVEGPQKACIGQPVVFALHGPGMVKPDNETVTWLFSDKDTLKGIQVTKTFQSSGKYQVQAVCQNAWSLTKEIQILALPPVSLPEQLGVDVGETLVIHPVVPNGESLPLIYQWDLGDGTRLNQAEVRHAYKTPGNFAATLRLQLADLNSCPVGMHSVQVKVYAKPDAAIEIHPDTLYSGGARDEATFKAVLADTARNFVYRWDFGDGQSASGQCAKHTYRQAGSYPVQLTVWDASRKSGKKYTYPAHVRVLAR